MSFTMVHGKARTAVDLARNSRMFIKSGPQIEYLRVIFTSPEVSLDFSIAIRPKFPNQPIITEDPRNPCIMIGAADLNASFAKLKMRDFDSNTIFAEHLVNMIAFINKNRRLATAPFLWSDYDNITPSARLYRMPSDEQLLSLSLRPASDISNQTEA